jgi:hypothetical protein
MDFREQILVNEVPIRLQPYTELRHKQLANIEGDIDKIVEKNPDMRFKDLDRSVKADIWMKKAKILWEPQPELGEDGKPSKLNAEFWDDKNNFFTKKFFTDPSFEYPLLKKSQFFFLSQEVFL